MSLLLDALKKSAEDKQKASQSKTLSDNSTTIQTSVPAVEETTNFSESFSQKTPPQGSNRADNNAAQDSEALTLDPLQIHNASIGRLQL